MLTAKARALLGSLGWHHLGFAFFWTTIFVGLTGFAGSEFRNNFQLYTLLHQGCSIVTVFLMVAITRKRIPFPPSYAIVAGSLLFIGSSLYWLTFQYGYHSLIGELCSGVAVGAAGGLFYVLWQQFFASEGASRTAIYVPFSAALAVVICFLLWFMPNIAKAICSVLILPVLSVVSLYKSLSEVQIDEPYISFVKHRTLIVVKDFWRPVFCVGALGFVWRLITHVFVIQRGYSFLVVMGSFGLAALAVALFELFSRRRFTILNIYQIFFPLTTGIFLLSVFLGTGFAPLVTGILHFGFEIINLLLLIACAVYSSENNLSSTHIYALCISPILIAMLIGDVLGTALSPLVVYDFTVTANVLFVCIFLLSIVLSSVAFAKRGHQESPETPASVTSTVKPVTTSFWEQDDGSLIDSSMEKKKDTFSPSDDFRFDKRDKEISLGQRLIDLNLIVPLSKREEDVADLVLKGNGVPAISRKLFISENTVRGHTKSIYRKVGVHSRQELIDLFDR